jgi:eukaryotic-like serine/threonine-protein kinase
MNKKTQTENLSPLDNLSEEQQNQLIAILEHYGDQLAACEPPDKEAILAANPELREALVLNMPQIEMLYQAGCDTDAGGDTKCDISDTGQKIIGDYQIEVEIGRGGMGVVYLARQISLGRPVALKVLPFASGLDQKQIERFRNEARAAAQLHHPNIVPVYTVGSEGGVHFYTMQFIDGRPLDRFVEDGTSLTTSWFESETGNSKQDESVSKKDKPNVEPSEQISVDSSPFGPIDSADHSRRIAQVGIQVASALDHAHEYGIIHRDIKPSNLIIDHNGKVWVTDFGLARIQTEANMTRTGDLIGTLRYMSPEQALGQSRVLDERTDIYSLGISLYELLTQRPAFDGFDRNAILHKISQIDPTQIRKNNPRVPIDLETIVMKSIAKNREDRYANCCELAADLRRFLAGEPTLARRPSMIERFARWRGRHKMAVRFATVLVAVALIALSTTTLLVSRAHQHVAAANSQIQTVNLKLQDALKDSKNNSLKANQSAIRAQDHFRKARKVLDQFGSRYAEQLGSIPGAEELRYEILRETLAYYKKFIRYAEDDPVLQRDMAVTYSKIGSIQDQLGQRTESLAAYRRAESILQKLVTADPNSANHQADLALCKNNIGRVLSQLGKVDEAKKTYLQAIEIQQTIYPAHPQIVRYQAELAVTLNNLGLLLAQTDQMNESQKTFALAIDLQRRLIRLFPEEPSYLGQLAISLDNQSRLYSQTDRVKAIDHCRRAIDLQRRLVESHPDVMKYQYDMALSYHNLGSLQQHALDLHAARDSYKLAIDLLAKLLRKAPSVANYRFQLAISQNNLGQIQSQLGDLLEAKKTFITVRDDLERFVDEHPNDPNYLSSLGGTLNNLGMVLQRLDEPGAATEAYQKAIKSQYEAMRLAPQVARFRSFLNRQYWNYARFLRDQGKMEAAGHVTLARKQLWSGRPDALLKIAGELAMTSANMEGHTEEADRMIRQWLTDEAIETIQASIEAGLKQPEKITKNQNLAVLLKDPRMRNILKKIGQSDNRANMAN